MPHDARVVGRIHGGCHTEYQTGPGKHHVFDKTRPFHSLARWLSTKSTFGVQSIHRGPTSPLADNVTGIDRRTANGGPETQAERAVTCETYQRVPLSEQDHDLQDVIRRVGFHPFIVVRRPDQRDPDERFLICRTQNDIGQFVNDLAALPGFRRSLLVRGMERALQLETYDAAALLFAWTKVEGADVDESLHVSAPEAIDLPAFFHYPMFSLAPGVSSLNTADRIAALVAAFNAYASTSGNDALRFALLQALGLGLSRALGRIGAYEQALHIVERALSVGGKAMHLEAARHTLLLKLEDQPVPARLKKFVGDDNGYLGLTTCLQPFRRFDIGPDGQVLLCCGHWLPTTIGNIMTQSVGEVLNSPIAERIRRSVIDGSYKYCDHLNCALMVRDVLPKRHQVRHGPTGHALATGDCRVDAVEDMLFAFDQTCNLSCPSCRTQLISEKASQSIEKTRAIEQKMMPLMSTLRTLHLNAAGELFASRPSRRLLEMINDETCPDLRLDIISNGTLFSQEEWAKFPGIHNKIRSVRISVDAATKETFEKLRRLGNYDTFLRNMRFLRDLRAADVIPRFMMSMTYQVDNYREMPAFIDFCHDMQADSTIFERLQNIAFTEEEYHLKAVHRPNHPDHAAFITLIHDPIFRARDIWHDFDYPGISPSTIEGAAVLQWINDD